MKVQYLVAMLCIVVMAILVTLAEVGKFTFTPLNSAVLAILFFVICSVVSFSKGDEW